MHRTWLAHRVAAVALLATVAAARAAGGQVAPSDLARTIDAEARVALFELTSGRALAALSRLQGLAATVDRDTAAAPERAAVHYLLAQCYYRLGMLADFRSEADAALAGGPRYASALRPQLVIEAYRAGDYARAASLASELSSGEANGVAGLAAGLAAYQAGDLAGARARFQRVAGASGDLAGYARYMDALAQLRADTAQPANAIGALEAVATSAAGDIADQARLTAAQVAYEGARYDEAVTLTSAIGPDSPLAAHALLTRAWALYKLERIADAERAFSEFVSRYPRLPERDEAELMAAQAQLELGRAADAERVFQRVADSSAAEVAALRAQTNAALAELARALVADRAAALLVASDPVSAKALVLHDSSSAAPALAAITGAPLDTEPMANGRAALVPARAGHRLDSLAAGRSPVLTRVLFTPASATRQPRELARTSQALADADAAVAVARYRLDEQIRAQALEIALLTRLAATLGTDSAALAAVAASYRTAADSMARLDQLLTAAEGRVRAMLGREVDAMRSLAAENVRAADSLRTALAPAAAPEDREVIEAEAATAAAYARIADMAARGLDSAIAHHPAFVARDSARAHAARARAQLAALDSSYTSAGRQLADAIAALRAGDAPATRAARQALVDAEARRAAAEQDVIVAVTAELSARAGERIVALERNAEAAQFGTASAAFFRAIGGTRTIGTADDAASGTNATADTAALNAAPGGAQPAPEGRSPRRAAPPRRR